MQTECFERVDEIDHLVELCAHGADSDSWMVDEHHLHTEKHKRKVKEFTQAQKPSAHRYEDRLRSFLCICTAIATTLANLFGCVASSAASG